MPFIRTIAPAESEGPVREMYERVRGRSGYVTNWSRAFSLRPGVMDGWKLLDALGVQADAQFNELDPALRQALTVGRPLADHSE